MPFAYRRGFRYRGNGRYGRMRVLVCIVVTLVVLVVSAAAGAETPRLESQLPAIPRLNYTDLFADLGLSSPADELYLYYYLNTARSIDSLAQALGVDTRTLPRLLLKQRQENYPFALRSELLERTQLVLSQPHLAQHMLFHVFHDWAMQYLTMPIYGLPWRVVWKLKYTDFEPRVDIAASQGVSYRELRRRTLAVEWAVAKSGVLEGALSMRQAEQRQAQLVVAVKTFLETNGMMNISALLGSAGPA